MRNFTPLQHCLFVVFLSNHALLLADEQGIQQEVERQRQAQQLVPTPTPAPMPSPATSPMPTPAPGPGPSPVPMSSPESGSVPLSASESDTAVPTSSSIPESNAESQPNSVESDTKVSKELQRQNQKEVERQKTTSSQWPETRLEIPNTAGKEAESDVESTQHSIEVEQMRQKEAEKQQRIESEKAKDQFAKPTNETKEEQIHRKEVELCCPTKPQTSPALHPITKPRSPGNYPPSFPYPSRYPYPLPPVILVPQSSEETLPFLNQNQSAISIFEAFNTELALLGNWFEHKVYGRVWQPKALKANWRPYTEGRWVNTERYGWYWQSNESWGWATYHYGRWVNDASVGWLWTPGAVWSSAWVAWQYNVEGYAWAPLPPQIYWQAEKGLSQQYDKVVNIPLGNWNVVSPKDFTNTLLSLSVLPISRNSNLINRKLNRYSSLEFYKGYITNFGIPMTTFNNDLDTRLITLDEEETDRLLLRGVKDATGSVKWIKPQMELSYSVAVQEENRERALAQRIMQGIKN